MQSLINSKAINDWFQQHQRIFPWRVSPTPYRVWISEVMLQQTRAAVVIAYFEKWKKLFPTVKDLAAAPIEIVIKAWEGLGYYSRARHLHEGALQIVRDFGGILPHTREELEKIKGLGPYTINAILSFAFHQKTAAVDGNVVRLLTRYFLIEEDVTKQATKTLVQELANQCLDESEPWVTAEGLIELGATVCQPKPNCPLCPLQDSCLARKLNRTSSLPLKAKAKPITLLERSVAVIEYENTLLIRKPAQKQLMASLYEFPYFEKKIETSLDAYLLSIWQLATKFVSDLPLVQHTFTRYKASLFPAYLHAFTRKEIDGFEWIEIDKITELPFSSGHRRILEKFLRDYK